MSNHICCDGCGKPLRQHEVALSGRWFDTVEVTDRRAAPPPEFDWCDGCRSAAFKAVRAEASARAQEATQTRDWLAQLGFRPLATNNATAVLAGGTGIGRVGEWVPQRRPGIDDPTEVSPRPRRRRPR